MLFETIQKDIITAMKAKNELVVSTLRMAKSAILIKEKDKQAPLTDAEVETTTPATSGLGTLVNRRLVVACAACKLRNHDKHTPKLRAVTRGFIKCECRRCSDAASS